MCDTGRCGPWRTLRTRSPDQVGVAKRRWCARRRYARKPPFTEQIPQIPARAVDVPVAVGGRTARATGMYCGSPTPGTFGFVTAAARPTWSWAERVLIGPPPCSDF
ncbi:hypothetical protein GCM10009780_43570 [Actinomadura alba]